MKKKILFIISIILIVIGIILINYTNIMQYFYERKVSKNKEKFIETISTEENKNFLDELYVELQNRNQVLYESEQENLVDPFSYEQSTIDLSEYGIDDNIIGYINIPKMNIELPIYLGANSTNMKKGATHLTETSYPIGGENTNSVIAAHRGYSTGTMFRHIDLLEVGDLIYIQNFREELTYCVYEIKIVDPDEISELKIEEDEDIITLITCHPYRINMQRYIVKAKRTE